MENPNSPNSLFILEQSTLDSFKRLAVGGDKLDRLTSLPINIKHQIQDRMSIEDATKMSILSSTWRYVWSSNPTLKFDTQFCKKRTLAETIDIISTILLQHHGAIKKFSLEIPIILPFQHSVVDKWMLFLSRNGLVDLTLLNLSNFNAPYKLPSYVYSVGLERLILFNCTFRPPSSFRGFEKLKRLSLQKIAFESEVATSSLWMPNLEKLRVIECSGLHFLKLTSLLSSWPNVHTLLLDSYFLKCFASGAEAGSLPTSLNRLRVLHLDDYDFYSENQMSQLLFVLTSSPNLEELQLFPRQRKKSDVEVDVNLLGGADCRTQGLNNLQKLLITNFHGSRTELSLVRFILASAPLLWNVILSVDTSVPESQSLKISKELMRFPRVSPIAEIIYESVTK